MWLPRIDDSHRPQRCSVEVFGATIERDVPELPGGPRATIIDIDPAAELDVVGDGADWLCRSAGYPGADPDDLRPGTPPARHT